MIFSSLRGEKSHQIIIVVLFFLSGAAGLIYEIIWERLLEIYFGVTLTAITLIVSAYLAGLGLGSLVGGRIAGRVKNVVLAYGVVEVAIAVFGFISPTLITATGQRTAGSPYPLVFIISFAILLIPTFLMGTTLPLLTQSFVNRVESSGRVIGLLYGINTLGAAFGTLIGGYVLIGWLGFDGATRAAVLLNLIAGFGAIILLGKQEQNEGRGDAVREKTSSASLSYRSILIAAFLVGFIDLGFEILWFRVLGTLNKTTAYNFPSALFVFLAGLAIGGYIFGRKADQSHDRITLFWKLQLGVGLVTAAMFLLFWGLLHLPSLQSWIETWFLNPQHPAPPYVWIKNEAIFSRRLMIFSLLEYFIPTVILVLPASLLMGGGLPILDRIAITSAQVSGQRVGDIHLANIFGSVGGTLIVSFVFLPLFGTELTLKILALLGLSFIGLAWTSWKNSASSRIILPAALVVLLLILPGRGEFYRRLYQTATGIDALVRESSDAVLVLGYQGNEPATLWIGGIQNSYFPTYGYYERTALTCASVSKPRRVLMIGLGGANTAYFMTQLPNVNQIVIVELIHDLGLLLDEFVPVAQRALRDPRVELIADDGRRYLYANPEEDFDLIFIDPLYSFTAGHNNLYSQEAMELYRSHLSPGGVFCGWFNENHVIPKTAANVFPYMIHFRDWVAASNDPIQIDRNYIQNVSAAYLANSAGLYLNGTQGALEVSGILEDQIADRAGTLAAEQETPILTDMHPWLEYYYFHKPY